MKKSMWWGILFLFPSVVFAEELTLSLEQQEYYFPLNQDGVISLKAINEFDQGLSGTMTYTITQSISQQGFQYSNTNVQSTTFALGKGESEVPLSFGTSSVPTVLDVSLSFAFSVDETYEVFLEGIRIHFVQDQTPEQNQANPQQSTSQPSSTPSQPPPPSQPYQNAQQKVQQNQVSTDSAALKQQIQQQVQQEQQLQEEFQRQLEQQPQVEEKHQQLLDQGYELQSGELNPDSADSGEFSLNYQKPSGEQASISGHLQNGSATDIVVDSQEIREDLLQKLQAHPSFEEHQEKLTQQGFEEQPPEFSFSPNQTTITVPYSNEQNETASLTAIAINESIVEITVERDRSFSLLSLLFMLVLLGFIGGLWFILHKEKKQVPVREKPKKAFDYRKQSKLLLEASIRLHKQGKQKQAFSKAAQALRLYLGHHHGSTKEMTSEELLKYLSNKQVPTKTITPLLEKCTLVEFAKYAPSSKDFNQMVQKMRKYIH